MLIDYINKNYSDSEPIFLNELPCKSKNALRQEMKKLVDEEKLVRLFNGVYYKKYVTILGTDGKMSVNKYIEKKYIKRKNKIYGYFSGLSMYNKYGFTSQIPSTFGVTSNYSTTKQRKLVIDNQKIIVYKPLVKISEDNINELEFLDLITNIDKFSELEGEELNKKIREFIVNKRINFEVVKKYIEYYPDRVFKNIYNRGLMNELV